MHKEGGSGFGMTTSSVLTRYEYDSLLGRIVTADEKRIFYSSQKKVTFLRAESEP